MEIAESVQRVERMEQEGPAMTSPFMTINQAATTLGVSRDHVKRALLAGRIPGFKFGDAYRVWRSTIQKVVAEMEAGRFVDFDDFAATQLTQVSEAAS